MNESTTTESTTAVTSSHASPRASLAALGALLRHRDSFGPVRQRVRIAQKTVKYSPTDKLYDGLIALLAGAHGLVEVNTRLRTDRALQQAFGRTACAEQSVIQQTLDACTAENVQQMQQALAQIYRQHSQGYRHDYQQRLQVLDADMSGLPCGKKAAFATRGYFARQRNRQGRQLGRVVASHYDEVVVDQVFAGATQLVSALPTLMVAAEQTLDLDVAKCALTIVRVDAGGGSLSDLNWLLGRSYQVMAKDYSSTRAARLAASVVRWVDDPRIEGRQIGYVTLEASEYIRPVVRIAVRCRKKNGQWGIGVLISTIDPSTIVMLTELSPCEWVHPDAELLAYVYFYDGRGGGVETTLKGDKQGLGMTKRNKKRFEAQQMLTLLGSLAHNLIVWARGWLRSEQPKLRRYGIVRMVRDVLQISGQLVVDGVGHLVRIILNQAAPLAPGLVAALARLLAPAHIAVTLGEI
jgi:hypothetical protein